MALPAALARPVENGATALASPWIGAGSCSWTSVTEPASATSTPLLAVLSCATKNERVPEPACGISGLMVPAVPPSWLQSVTVPS